MSKGWCWTGADRVMHAERLVDGYHNVGIGYPTGHRLDGGFEIGGGWFTHNPRQGDLTVGQYVHSLKPGYATAVQGDFAGPLATAQTLPK